MKHVYRKTYLTFCALVVVVLSAGAASADITTFTAVLNGSNEVPGVATTAVGTATLTLIDPQPINAVPFHLEFTGLVGTQTGAHIHVGAAGTNGAVIIALPTGSPVDTTVDLVNVINLAQLAAGNLYVNVHSTAFPGGEIRGQLLVSSTVAEEDTNWGSIKALFR